MKTLFLTNNPNLGSTSRILQAWLRLGNEQAVQGAVVGRSDGDLVAWLRGAGVGCLVDPMPWPDKRRAWQGLWHAARVARWGRRQKVDVIHCNEHDIYPFVSVVQRFLNRPTVCHVRFKVERRFAEWAFGGRRVPDALLWTSHQQKADSADSVHGIVPEDRQHVVRLGIDLETFGYQSADGLAFRRQMGVQDDEILIGIPAPLRPRKRVHDFISLIQRLAPRHPKVVALIAGGEIAGDEEYRVRIEREVAESGLGRRLRWVGNLEPVEPFHHACDISVSTSEYETFGNSVCEAMACGKPVVGYVGGSVGEVIGDAGIVVPDRSIAEMARAVEQLIVSRELRESLGAAARQRVAAEFSPAASLRQVRGIYEQIIGH